MLSLVLVALYPLAKRITWWPQAVLGVTFGWGAPMGYAAATGRLDPAALALHAAAFAWILGYDTIYAHQDREDDALIGVRSTARLLRPPTPCRSSPPATPPPSQALVLWPARWPASRACCSSSRCSPRPSPARLAGPPRLTSTTRRAATAASMLNREAGPADRGLAFLVG